MLCKEVISVCSKSHVKRIRININVIPYENSYTAPSHRPEGNHSANELQFEDIWFVSLPS
jgi:hypothetical protein